MYSRGTVFATSWLTIPWRVPISEYCQQHNIAVVPAIERRTVDSETSNPLERAFHHPF